MSTEEIGIPFPPTLYPLLSTLLHNKLEHKFAQRGASNYNTAQCQKEKENSPPAGNNI